MPYGVVLAPTASVTEESCCEENMVSSPLEGRWRMGQGCSIALLL